MKFKFLNFSKIIIFSFLSGLFLSIGINAYRYNICNKTGVPIKMEFSYSGLSCPKPIENTLKAGSCFSLNWPRFALCRPLYNCVKIEGQNKSKCQRLKLHFRKRCETWILKKDGQALKFENQKSRHICKR